MQVTKVEYKPRWRKHCNLCLCRALPFHATSGNDLFKTWNSAQGIQLLS